MQRKQIFYLLAIVALLVSLLPPLTTAALAQESVVPLGDAPNAQTCKPLSAAEQQEFDRLTAIKAADALAGANLARYDALAQQLNCYSAQKAAGSPAAAQPAGATRMAPTVTKTVGTTGADYATLKLAFDDINNGTLTGSVQLDVIDDTTETAPAVLNASGSGSASYTAVLIQPSGGAARTISGAIAAGSPLIDLNGADNVTIDGLNTGGNSLTVANTTVSATSGTSTIRFQADATSNTITRASILGSSTMATTTNGGNIWFGAAAITTGNDNNVISNCNIGPAGANLPTKAIYGNGTTTSTATYNSGNQITDNNIYDYFNPAAQANAVYLGAGNTAWTISNNRIYQTATRTQTTGAILAGIQAASSTGNEGHTISGNVIGFANSAGTGTTNLVGIGTGSKFLGIYFSSAGTTTPSSIQGNTIAGINLSGVVGGTSTTAAFVGISIASGVANIGNVTGNTIGSLSTAGSVSVTSNNASAMEVYGMYYFPSAVANVSNNNVGGIVATNSGAGSLVLYGLRAFTSSSVVNTFANNTVGSAAAPISVSSSATGSRLLGLYSQSGASVVTGNTISNLTLNSPNVGTGSSASLIGLWSDNSSATLGNNIAQNTVYALSNSNATAAVWVTGLHYNGSTTGTHLVQRNFVYNLSSPSTSATATVNGINVQAGAATYQNNMVVLGNDMTANSPAINGINEVVGTNNFYHNSVYIGGADVAAGTANSFAFNSVVTVNTRAYRDNIFYNARSNGAATGKHYAIQVGGTAPNPAGLTSNNNVLYASGTGGFVGRFNALDQAMLANWQAATGQDANSFSLDPQFLAPAAAAPDLHLNPSIATVAEGNGFLIASVLDDFDGQTRATLTPVDIGADAGDFIGVDLSGPTITYTPLANTLSTSNRTFSNVTITDPGGVNTTAGTKPRVYYKRSTDGNVWNDNTSSTDGWKYAEASGTTSPFDFTIDYSLLNGGAGVTTGDVVQYFVVAQDLATTPNVSINSGVFAAPPSSVALTAAAFPIGGTINSYLIATAFSGTYSVPGSYPSLTNAGGIFEALNAGILTGDVVIDITADLTSETGAVALNQLAEAVMDSPFTVTIKPSGGARTISGTSAANSGLIILNGADNVTIDGSTSGGTDQSLTITNLNTTGVVIWMRSASTTNGATNNTVKNCLINGSSGTTTIAGILSSGTTLGGDAEAANSNNTIQNNVITKVQNALYLRGGATAPTWDQNWLVTENTFGSTVAADKLGFRGMLIGNAQNFTVSKNTINGVVSSTSSSSTMSGIQVALAVSGGLISQNKISDIKQINTTGWGSNGIYLAATSTASNVTVANNFVSDVASYGYAGVTQGDNGYGIMVNSGGGYKIVYNSVLMSTNQTATTGIPAAINIASGITTPGAIELVNNIFANIQTVGTRYAIYSAAPASVFSTINYNNYYPGTGTLGYLGAAQTTLAAWQAATGQDANSVVGDPLFVSNTDLHITNESSSASNAGTPIAGVTIDIDGQPRSPALPDIGADEFGSVPQAAITLNKTVGTDPLTCATTNAITLPYGGGSVTYCYEVTNTGDVTLNQHDLMDSELGALLTNLTYALAPGASAFVTETTTINVTTVNSATWTAYNTGGPSVQATDTATVTVEGPAPAIVLAKTVGTDPMVCATTDEITVAAGTDVTYCYDVTNTGNVALNLHDLDDSELGNIFSGLNYALAPGASAFVTATTTINVTTVNTATWTAYNAGPIDVVTASDVATVTVQAAANPAITLNKTVGTVPAVCAATNQISVPYGTSVYYCYQVQNTGNVTMTVHSLVDDQLGTLATNLTYVLPPGAFSPQIIVPDTAVIAVTNTATWTAASSVGYTVDTNAPFNYIPINATGMGLGLTDDGEANITIPWAATFFGVTSSNLRVGNNGVILFNATAGDVGTANAALPNAALGLAIAPFWDDIDSDTGDVYWEVQGTAPNRMLIVEWYNRPHFSNIGSATFQAILYETSNEIKYQYLDVDFGDPLYSFGASATVGINKDATTALQVSFNQPVIQNGQAILFTPAAILTASDSDWAEVNVLIPNIDVAPLSLSATQATNTTTNQPLNIGNTGDAPLTWEITETEPDAAPRSDVQAAPEPVFDVPAVVSSKADCAAFENYPGKEPEGWAEFCGQPAETPASSPQGPTSNGYSVDLRNDRVVRFALNNFPGQVLVGPQTGNLYGLDFDSTATTLYALNDATIDQLGTVNTTTGVFTPIVDCPAPAGGTWTGLSIDPVTNVFYASTAANLYTIDSATCSPTLIGPFGVTGGIMIDIAIGSAGVMYGHDIFTDSIYTIDTNTGAATLVGPTGFLANFAQGMDFDNEDGTLYIWLYIGTGANRYGTVNLATGAVTPLATDNPLGEFEGATETLGLCIPTDYGWLSLTPTAGTTAPAATTAVDVAFDSTGLAVGTYTGQLCVRSNDPDNGPGNETNLVIVPVTLTVQPPTAVALDGLAASSEPAQAPLPLAGLPLAALPAAVGLALGAAYVLRRKA